MEKLDINLDEDFKNINTDLKSSSNGGAIGIDLLVNSGSNNNSPKSNQTMSINNIMPTNKSFFTTVVDDNNLLFQFNATIVKENK